VTKGKKIFRMVLGKGLESWLRRLLFWVLIRFLGLTARITRINWHVLEELEAKGQNYLLALWHNNIFFLIHAIAPYRHPALVSRSRDGDDVDWIMRRFGYHNVRGSASDGGLGALRGALRLLGQGQSLSITPDGPRGPRYRLKPGIVALAAKRKVPVVPVCFSTDRRWELGSWDRQKLPKPFARVVVMVGDPLWPAADGRDSEEAQLAWLEAHMRDQARLAERYCGADTRYPDEALFGDV